MVVARVRNLRIVLDGLAAEAAKARDELAVALTANLTIATPVRTGWARANWVPSLGEPTTDPVRPTTAAQAAREAPGQLARQQGAVLQLLSQGPTQPDAKAYVSNHTPYIGALNDGHSQQQAAGWVEREIKHTVDDFQARLTSRHVEL